MMTAETVSSLLKISSAAIRSHASTEREGNTGVSQAESKAMGQLRAILPDSSEEELLMMARDTIQVTSTDEHNDTENLTVECTAENEEVNFGSCITLYTLSIKDFY